MYNPSEDILAPPRGGCQVNLQYCARTAVVA